MPFLHDGISYGADSLYFSYYKMNLQQRIKKSKRTGKLDISNMGLTTMPTLPPGLIFLNCSNNRLTSLGTLPPTLTELDCSNNQLVTLPTLPSTLTHLCCSNDQLTTLPTLPSMLTWLACNCNQLTTLPILPSMLTLLICYDNQLTTLPTLPSTLIEYIDCSHNRLQTLPPLPSTLTWLACKNNPYTQVFADLMGTTYEETIQGIRMYYVKEQSRNVLALHHTLGKGYNCVLNDDCLNLVGSYLSGQSGTLPMQITRLRTILTQYRPAQIFNCLQVSVKLTDFS